MNIDRGKEVLCVTFVTAVFRYMDYYSINDKGKTGENRRRKAMGLKPKGNDCQAARFYIFIIWRSWIRDRYLFKYKKEKDKGFGELCPKKRGHYW